MAVTPLDSVSSQYGHADISYSLSTGDNRIVVVWVGYYNTSGRDCTAVTFDGVAMTLGASSTQVYRDAQMWYMLEADLPAGGSSYTVSYTVTSDSLPRFGTVVRSYQGVNQALESTVTNAQTSVRYPSLSFTTSTGDLVLGAYTPSALKNCTPYDWDTEEAEVGLVLADFCAVSGIEDSGTTETWNIDLANNSDDCVQAGISFKEYTGVTVSVPTGEITFTGTVPFVALTAVNVVPTGEITFTGTLSKILETIPVPVGKIYFNGKIPLIGDEDLHIRSADGSVLLGTISAGDATMLVSDGVNWYLFKLPKED